MTAKPHSVLPSPLQIAGRLAAEFARTAAERDERGGTPKAERDALRHSGLLALRIPSNTAASAPAGATPWTSCASSPRSTARLPMCSASSI